MRETPLLLFVVNDAGFFKSHRWQLAKAAQEAGYSVEIACPDDELINLFSKEGFIAHIVPFTRKNINPIYEIKTIFGLWNLYKKLKPDLIHHITIKPVIYGGIISRIQRLPRVIFAITGLGYIFSLRSKKAAVVQAIVRKIYHFVLGYEKAFTIYQNPDDRKEIWGDANLSRNLIIRGSGVDQTQFNYSCESDELPIVGMASRMLWSKGVGDFVEAAKRCRNNNISCRFVLIGDGDPGNPESVPTLKLKQWNAEGIVEWWGKCTDMPDVLKKLHLVVLPTLYREGVPKVLIEAAATGRPLIGTDMPGCREIIQNNKNGMLIPPGDINALVTAISDLVNKPEKRRVMGLNSRELFLSEFTLEHVISNTLELYKSLFAN